LLNVSTVWLAIVGMGIITFLLRLSFIALLGRRHLSTVVQRGLDLVPPAVFFALIFPDLFRNSVMLPLSVYMNARLIAGIVAILVAWRTRNVVLTIAVGLIVLLAVQTFL
jgi:branched-subunit amino acid transport protein